MQTITVHRQASADMRRYITVGSNSQAYYSRLDAGIHLVFFKGALIASVSKVREIEFAVRRHLNAA